MEAEAPSLIYTVASFLVLLSVLVFVHELGHYSVARWLGIRVSIFSIGFGPEIFGWTAKSGTRWKISWVPLGGYVKFFGDANAASAGAEELQNLTEEEKKVTFALRPVSHRAAVVAAGPLVNFLFAIFVFTLLFAGYGQPVGAPVFSNIVEGSPAAEAGFQPGDRVISIEDEEIESFDEIQNIVRINTGTPLTFTVERGGIRETVTVTPEIIREEDRFGNTFETPRLGVQSGPIERRELGPLEAVGVATVRTWELTGLMLTTVGQMIRGDRSVDDLGGPVRIAQFTGQSATLGLVSFVTFMALISINLGLVNLFPIPMLDGGHLLFYGIEAVQGKPLNPKVQEMGFMIGLALILGLFLLVTWNDILNLQ